MLQTLNQPIPLNDKRLTRLHLDISRLRPNTSCQCMSGSCRRPEKE